MVGKIEIVLTTDDSLLSRVARLLGAKWTHSMLRFVVDYEYRPDDDRLIMGRNVPEYHIIESAFRHGVVERAWNPEEYSEYAIYKFKPDEIYDDFYEDLLEEARKRIGRRYAFEMLPLLLPRFLRRFINRFVTRYDPEIMYAGMLLCPAEICTSLVDESVFYCGIDLVPDIDTPWVLPSDFMDSPLLELVEEG